MADSFGLWIAGSDGRGYVLDDRFKPSFIVDDVIINVQDVRAEADGWAYTREDPLWNEGWQTYSKTKNYPGYPDGTIFYVLPVQQFVLTHPNGGNVSNVLNWEVTNNSITFSVNKINGPYELAGILRCIVVSFVPSYSSEQFGIALSGSNDYTMTSTTPMLNVTRRWDVTQQEPLDLGTNTGIVYVYCNDYEARFTRRDNLLKHDLNRPVSYKACLLETYVSDINPGDFGLAIRGETGGLNLSSNTVPALFLGTTEAPWVDFGKSESSSTVEVGGMGAMPMIPVLMNTLLRYRVGGGAIEKFTGSCYDGNRWTFNPVEEDQYTGVFFGQGWFGFLKKNNPYPILDGTAYF